MKEGVGRTDVGTGNEELMKLSVEKMKNVFADNQAMIIYPGHGENTVFGEAIQLKMTKPNIK